MFERFSEQARRVIVSAQEEARYLNHNYIGTEHLLLGLLGDGESTAAKALEGLGVSVEAAREQVEAIVGPGQHEASGHIPFTPRGRRVLELALRESLRLGHERIGTEHLLLGLVREGEGVAAQVLVRLCGDLSRVRQQVIRQLHTNVGDSPHPEPFTAWESRRRTRGSETAERFTRIEARLERIERHLGIEEPEDPGDSNPTSGHG